MSCYVSERGRKEAEDRAKKKENEKRKEEDDKKQVSSNIYSLTGIKDIYKTVLIFEITQDFGQCFSIMNAIIELNVCLYTTGQYCSSNIEEMYGLSIKGAALSHKQTYHNLLACFHGKIHRLVIYQK